MKVYFFGCWNRPGHFWFAPSSGGSWIDDPSTPFAHWIDGGWAPRRWHDGYVMRRNLVKNPGCCWLTEAPLDDDRRSMSYVTSEHEQGRYLLHVRDGWTLLSWWDRTQGDSRGACNSNLVAEGAHTDETMLVLLREHFPHVVENLDRAGVVLAMARAS